MSLQQSNEESASDWGWLRDNDSTSAEDTSVTGIGVLGVHLHRLIIDKMFHAYALNRYSKTVRALTMDNRKKMAQFNQTMQMMIRIYDKRHDQRHLIHIILYGYLTREQRYALIADHVLDSVKLVSRRHISEAVVFEGTNSMDGKGTLLIELIFVYGRHGYNFSSQLIFNTDLHVSNALKTQTLFEHIESTDGNTTTDENLTDDNDIDLPIYLMYSFDELTKYVANGHDYQDRIKNARLIRALSTSSKYSSMSAIMDMYSSRKQRLEMLFDFLTEGPHIPEQNIIEPTAARLIPWTIAYWKRGLAGIPLHGSTLDISDCHQIEMNTKSLENTSPILRELLKRAERQASLTGDTTKLNTLKELVRHVLSHSYHRE